MVATLDPPAVEFAQVTKRFPGVTAVDGVDLTVLPGEVHVLAGENGAGKSTLMKLLSQVERPSSGEIRIGGQLADFQGPQRAQQLGIAMVYQEFALAPHLSVAENLFLGREPSRMGIIRRGGMDAAAQELLDRVGLRVPPGRLVRSLPVAAQQLVEIAKALAIDARVLVLDEPTATLTEREIDALFAVIRDLTAQGIAVLYISHRLDEIFRIADRVTVMRDGAVVDTVPREGLDERGLIRMMVGREIENLYPKPEVRLGDPVLEVRGLSRAGVLHDCSFAVRAGEIVGFAGLVGAGRTELARAVFGADPVDGGDVRVDGAPVHATTPHRGIDAGIGYVTEDRKGNGLALQLGIDQNITLAHTPLLAGPVLDLRAERRVAEQRVQDLRIRTPSIRRRVQVLSGGNQQKVVVAKWLETQARVLFFDEPGRGIDVGSKAEMFDLIGDTAQQGRAVVLISSYLPELINMCDRILVLHEGRIAGELTREQFSEERIIALATGVEAA